MRIGRIWSRRRDEQPLEGMVLLSRSDFDEVLARRVRALLDMDIDEFRSRAATDELPETPAVDHLRFLIGT